MDNGISGL